MDGPKNHKHPLPPKKRFFASISENSEQVKKPPATNSPSYEFAFAVKNINVLKDAFQALSDTTFNPKQDVVIQVAQPGCDFTVWKFNLNSGHESFGYMSLEATNLERFECKNPPFRKSFSLKGIPALFRTADRLMAKFMLLYSVEGSNQISFKWGTEALECGRRFPVNVDLRDVETGSEPFPNCISYRYEAVLHSSFLRMMSAKLLKRPEPLPDPDSVVMSFQPATMEIMAEEMITNTYNEEAEQVVVATECRHWESLESACESATKVSVYLVTDPGSQIMFRFYLEELGDLVYLSYADFKLPPSLPFLGRFRTLIKHSPDVTQEASSSSA